MELTELVLIGFMVIVFGLTLLYLGYRSATSEELNRRLQEHVVETASIGSLWPEESEIRRQEVRGSFASRTVVPGFRFVGGIFGRFTPKRSVQNLETDLIVAGRPLGLGAREFSGIRILFLLLGLLLGYLMLTRGNQSLLTLIFATFVTMITVYFPKWWLTTDFPAIMPY